MKITVRVTKKLIEKHWNGTSTSCPIHEAAIFKKVPFRFTVMTKGLQILDRWFWFPEVAADFSTAQSMFESSSMDRICKKEALRILKPITFKLDIPKRYLRKGVRG